ncbi:hybrid sensor histidine kinase/response regulator [Burkholderia sp. lig30]|uniref:hybrid sensor histidine kinase/response regulator n=1 Tax=Burkholderia sp. lig30 TaxID=1192124 RepID=UPI0009FB13FE|nr:ATP-binding protein [Burkholderia sp. lig30]
MRTPSSPTLLARFRAHQQMLLFAGTAAVTALVVLAFALATAGVVHTRFADEYGTFTRDLAGVIDSVKAAEIRVRFATGSVQNSWKRRGPGAPEDLRQFEADGRIVFPESGDTNIPLMLSLPAARKDDAQAVSRLLAIARGSEEAGVRFAGMMGSSMIVRWNPRGYIVTPAGATVGLLPMPDLSDPRVAAALADRARLLRFFGSGLDGFAGWPRPPHGQPGKLKWLPPAVDPLSGRTYFRVAALAFDGAHAFAAVVGEFEPSELFAELEGREFEGTYTVVDEDGRPVASTSADVPAAPLVARVQARQRRAAVTEITSAYEGGMLTVSRGLGDSGWTLIYTVPWQVIARSVAASVAAPALLTAFAVALLWGFVILFNRKTLAPLFERSERVFDSEHLSRKLIETAPVGLALVKVSDNTVLLESAHMQALEARIGERGGALIGDALQRHAPAAFRKQRGGESVTTDVQLHWPTGDGDAIDVAAKLTPAHYQGQPVVVAAFSDVTAERQLARQLTAAKQAADSANAAKSTFLAAMSHEIRTPLNAILGHLELLERLPQAAPVAGRVRTVASSSRALLDILNDILDFSKVEAGEMNFESIPFDIGRLIGDTVAMMMPLAQRKGLTLTASVDAGLARQYVGDPARIRQVVVNLLGNAIKFTDRGSVSIAVRAQADGAAHRGARSPLVVSVTDTGVGIPADRLAHIFDAFMQADESITRRFGGTGLGLALCKRIVDAMAGMIAVDSAVGRGSAFTVTLPLPPAGVGAGEPDADARDAAPGDEADLRGLHVLVAEDHEVNRELIRDQLDMLGYTSDVVENGRVALRHFNERHYDVVLTDLGMPVMDGYTLAACLRNQGARTPVIAITADVTAAETRRFREAGISGVLLKPMSLTSIEAAVRCCLKRASDPHAASPAAGRAAGDGAVGGGGAGGKAVEGAAGAEGGAGDAGAAGASRGTAGERVPLVLSAKLRGILAQRTAESLAVVRDALGAGDWATIGASIHSIKGAFAMIDQTEVTEVCVRIEAMIAAAAGPDIGAIGRALDELDARVAHALAQLDAAACDEQADRA